jgi:F0F1-type ATP synthase membrane subunit b/b'
MKKSILILTATTFITGTLLMSCNNSAEKVENAQEKVEEAKEELDEANKEYLKDVENYRKETSDRISENERIIVDLRTKKDNAKKEIKEEYRKKIDQLEQKNKELKKKIDEYQVSTKEDWERFKREFNSDMDELGKAFKDLTVDNVK